MFTYLSRLGHLFIAIPILVGVIVIFGSGALSPVPVASHHKDPSCSISPNPAGLNQAFTISAAGLPTIDPVYLITTPPNGGGGVKAVIPNGDGSWSGTAVGNLAGTWTYTFSGLMANNKYGAVASCSVRVG